MAGVRYKPMFLCPSCFEHLKLISAAAGERLVPDLAYSIEGTTCDRCGKYTIEVIVVCST